MWAIIFLSVIAVSYAQFPTPCEAPKQWEARRYKIDRTERFEEIAFHTYDEVNQRTRSVEEVIEGVQKDYYEKIHLHAQHKQYIINLKTKTCNVTVDDRPFRPIGVPPGANFTFLSEAGAASIPNEHMTVQGWKGTFPEDGGQFMIQLTYPGCVPISLDVNVPGFQAEYFHERYFDLKVGISEPERFIPPPECNA